MLKHSTSSKKRLLLVAGLLAAFLVVLNTTTYTLYRRAKTQFDGELGERLRAIATGLAHTVALTSDSLTVAGIDPSVFHQTMSENDLSNIVLVRPNGATILDLSGFIEAGEQNPFIDLDFSAVALARSGVAAYTNLYRVDDVYMKSAYAPVDDGGGNVYAIVGVEAGAAFFTELRELARMLVFGSAISALAVIVLGVLFYRQTRSLDRAQEAMIERENLSTLGRMVANIAHEIRNPLSIINTSAQRLKRKHHIEDEAVDYIIEEVDNLNAILTGYLQFAQSKPVEFSAHPGRSIITRCMMAVHEQAAAKKAFVSDHLPASEVMLFGDEKRIRQAVLNVLVNAVEAIGEGGRVDISLEPSTASAAIVVADDGPGIPPEHINEVTKPFFTQKTNGSGLGLNIVQAIVEEHNGRLDISSNTGRGTRVTLTFPLASA